MFTLGTNCHCSIAGSTLQTKSACYHLHRTRNSPQHIVDQFWKRWTKAYLLELQSRQKWLSVQPNCKVGDIVLICDEAIPRGMWPLGLVEETKIGRDGLVRSVKVRAKNSVFLRPIKVDIFGELWLNNVWEHLCCWDSWVFVVIP